MTDRLYTEADVLAIVDEALMANVDHFSGQEMPDILAVLIVRAEADKAPMSWRAPAADISPELLSTEGGKPTIAMWPELRIRLDAIDSRHAHVSLFDHGARAGTLVLDRRTWELLTRYDKRMVPERGDPFELEDSCDADD